MTRRYSDKEREALLVVLARKYRAGASIRALAAEHRLSYTATRRWLLLAGVELRPRCAEGPVAPAGGDPLERPCPGCGAGAGSQCRSPYGRLYPRSHVARRRLA